MLEGTWGNESAAAATAGERTEGGVARQGCIQGRELGERGAQGGKADCEVEGTRTIIRATSTARKGPSQTRLPSVSRKPATSGGTASNEKMRLMCSRSGRSLSIDVADARENLPLMHRSEVNRLAMKVARPDFAPFVQSTKCERPRTHRGEMDTPPKKVSPSELLRGRQRGRHRGAATRQRPNRNAR